MYIDDLHPAALSIGDNCSIGMRTSILTHFYWGPRRATSNGQVVIENDVFVGPHCVILPNVRIGEGLSDHCRHRRLAKRAAAHLLGSSAGPKALAEVSVPTDRASTRYAEFLRGMKPTFASRGTGRRAD